VDLGMSAHQGRKDRDHDKDHGNDCNDEAKDKRGEFCPCKTNGERWYRWDGAARPSAYPSSQLPPAGYPSSRVRTGPPCTAATSGPGEHPGAPNGGTLCVQSDPRGTFNTAALVTDGVSSEHTPPDHAPLLAPWTRGDSG
jgi:hypothetical protein